MPLTSSLFDGDGQEQEQLVMRDDDARVSHPIQLDYLISFVYHCFPEPSIFRTRVDATLYKCLHTTYYFRTNKGTIRSISC